MSWSKWRFLVEPHRTQRPWSRRQTSTLTAVGMRRLWGSSTIRPKDSFFTGFSENLNTLRLPSEAMWASRSSKKPL